jgi:hypothetical protein
VKDGFAQPYAAKWTFLFRMVISVIGNAISGLPFMRHSMHLEKKSASL